MVRVSIPQAAQEIIRTLPKTEFTQGDVGLRGLLNALGDSGFTVIITNRPHLGRVEITIIPPEALHIDPSAIFDMLSHSPHLDLEPFRPSQMMDSQTSALWVNLPQHANGQEAAQTAVRFLFQSGNLSQESLKQFFLMLPSQNPLQGGQFISGATLTLSPEHLAAMLLPFTNAAESPEMARAMMIAQTLLPSLMAFQPNGAALVNLLQTALRAENNTQPTGEKILASFAQLISKNGLISFEEVKTLFKAFLEAENLRAGGGGESSVSEQLQRIAQRLAVSNHPQVMSLVEFSPNQAGQGLSQILNSVLRVLMGVMILNPQNQWPHALPLESMLLELKRFIGPTPEKTDTKKWKEKLKQKRHGRFIAEEDDEEEDEEEDEDQDEEEEELDEEEEDEEEAE